MTPSEIHILYLFRTPLVHALSRVYTNTETGANLRHLLLSGAL